MIISSNVLPSPSQVHQPAPHAKPSQKPPRPTHWQTWPGCSENPERIISPDFSHVNCATLWILTHMWYCYYLMFAVARKESPLALPDEAEVCCSPSQQQKWTNWMNCNWFAVNSHVPIAVNSRVFHENAFSKKNKCNPPRISLGVNLKGSKRIFDFDQV